MAKTFNVTADCKPGEHYMVNLDWRLEEIKELVDSGKYFTINRARQYGKTTVLRALNRYLQGEYYAVLMDFQTFGDAKFKNENIFAITFGSSFLRMLKRNHLCMTEDFKKALTSLEKQVDTRGENFEQKELFEALGDICGASDRRIVLMIDEVDSATNNQVFLDFLSQLRAGYIDRDVQPAFQSVILAGVYDVKNLRRKIRTEDEHKINSPWNIAADFKVEMSFSEKDIKRMLEDYESDYRTGMETGRMAELLYDYTSGYPFLVSKLCKLIDEEISGTKEFPSKSAAWTNNGLNEAVRLILTEKNTLFESLSQKLTIYPELNEILKALLFNGKSIAYNPDEPAVDMAAVFGFIKNQGGSIAIANRIFETRLYNYYLSAAEMKEQDINNMSLMEKNQFIVEGDLNMRKILERFVVHFDELYHNSKDVFVEEIGRKYFLLYLRPIINGTGNYYIESRTRSLGRTDVVVDFNGKQYVIEMKIWRGNEYNRRGENQLIGYLDDFRLNKGYMVSFNFNKNKQIGVKEIIIGDKTIIEAVV